MDKYTQWKIQELKEKKMIEQRGICAGCNKQFRIGDITELAHILKQGKYTESKYSKDIIQHELNMKLTHSGYCNSSVQMNTNKTELVNEHIQMIENSGLN